MQFKGVLHLLPVPWCMSGHFCLIPGVKLGRDAVSMVQAVVFHLIPHYQGSHTNYYSYVLQGNLGLHLIGSRVGCQWVPSTSGCSVIDISLI